MSIPEVIITVCCTVAGSTAIAYTTFHLQAKHRKRTLFRALYDEIKRNRHLAEQQQMLGMERAPERGSLYTGAYQNIGLAGELLTLPESVRQELESTYELINTNNRKIPTMTDEILDKDVDKRIGNIIKNLKYLEGELPKHISDLETSNHKPQHEPQKDLLRRYIMVQVPTFFFLGLSLILAHALLALRSGTDMSIWGRVQGGFGLMYLPMGVIAILWAFALSTVALNYKIPRKLKRAQEAITEFVERKNEPLYYVASMTVFGTTFGTILANMIQAGISALHFYILYGMGLLLTLILFVYNIRSARHQKRIKVATTQNSESQNQDA